MAPEVNPESFGVLRGEVTGLKDSIERLGQDLKDLTHSVNILHADMATAKGGWKVILALSGVAGTVGAGFSWIISHIRWG